MNELEEIAREIERVRAALHRLALRKDCAFNDPEVIRLSENLDILIVRYQRGKTEAKEMTEEKSRIAR